MVNTLSTTCRQCKRPYTITREDLMRGYVTWSRCPDCRQALARENREKLAVAKERRKAATESVEDGPAAATPSVVVGERGEIDTAATYGIPPLGGGQDRRGDLHRGNRGTA